MVEKEQMGTFRLQDARGISILFRVRLKTLIGLDSIEVANLSQKTHQPITIVTH